MATKITVPAFRGVLVPASLIAFANLADNDGSDAGSYWSAADRGPGGCTADDPLSTFRAEISGAQDRTVQVVVRQGGFTDAGLYGAARLGYRYPSDTLADGGDYAGPAGDGAIRGWDAPTTITDYRVFRALSANLPNVISACVVPSRQYVVTLDDQGNVSTWDPYTDTMVANSVTVEALGLYDVAAIVCLPGTERLLAYVSARGGWTAYYSDDHGLTWDVYALDVLGTGTDVASPTALRVVAAPSGEIGMFVVKATEMHQYVSLDNGATFTSVESKQAFASTTWAPDVAITPQGRVVVVYPTGGASDQLSMKVLASPGAAFSSGTTINGGMGSVTVDAGHVCCDADGVVWVVGQGAAKGPCELWRWVDSVAGDVLVQNSSELCAHGPWTLGTGLTAKQGQLVCAAGAARFVTTYYDATNLMQVCVTLGGWSNIVHAEDLDAVTQTAVDSRRVGEGAAHSEGSSNAVGASYLPFGTPGTLGAFTAVGAGAEAITYAGTDGMLQVVTTANTRFYSKDIGTRKGATAMVTQYVNSGGTLASLKVGPKLTIADGTVNHQISVRCSSTQIQAFDEIAGTSIGTAVTISGYVELKLCQRQYTSTGDHTAEVYYRQRGSKVWAPLGASNNLTNGGALATGNLQWGVLSSDTVTAYFRMAKVYAQDNTGSSDEWHVWRGSPCRGYQTNDSDPGHWPVIGKAAGPYPYPLAEAPAPLLEAGTGAPFVRGVGGPARFGERFTCDVAYGYGPDRLFPDMYPSPLDGWRSEANVADALDHWFTFTADFARTLGSWSVGLFLSNVNFRTAYLQEWTGAAWSTIATFDAASSTGLKWTRTGDVITVTATSAAGARFYGDNELVGGAFYCDGTPYRIVENSAGVWKDAATMHLTIRIAFESAPGASGTAGAIWSHSGVLIAHKQETPRTRYRLFLPQQATVDVDYRIGKMLIGGFIPFGRQWSNGWAFDADPNVEITEDQRGTTYGAVKGPPRRSWTVAWTDGVLTRQLVPSSDPSPDYLASSSASQGKALAARNDVASLALGVLTRLQGKVCVLLRSVPTSDAAAHMITDPELFLYSRMGALRTEHIAGPEDRGGWSSPAVRPAGEVLRVGPVQFSEVV